MCEKRCRSTAARSAILGAALLLASFWTHAGSEAQTGPRFVLPVPSPQYLNWENPGQPAWSSLERLGQVLMESGAEAADPMLDMLDGLRAEHGLEPARRVAMPGEYDKSAYLWLGLEIPARLPRSLAKLPKPRKAEGYRLAVTGNHAFVLGLDPAGLFRGVSTLLGLVQEDGRIPQVVCTDWPNLPRRGVYLDKESEAGVPFCENGLANLARGHINMLVFRPGQLDYTEADWAEVGALCRRYFIEPVPMFPGQSGAAAEAPGKNEAHQPLMLGLKPEWILRGAAGLNHGDAPDGERAPSLRLEAGNSQGEDISLMEVTPGTEAPEALSLAAGSPLLAILPAETHAVRDWARLLVKSAQAGEASLAGALVTMFGVCLEEAPDLHFAEYLWTPYFPPAPEPAVSGEETP